MIKTARQIAAWALYMAILPLVSAQIRPTPATERLKSLQNRGQLAQQSTVNQVPFKNIGPAVMSGRVVDLEVNPADPTEIYVAYATGGLWHTTNNGQSFTPVFDSTHTLFIGDIAVNWAGQRTIWVGTGEVNSSRSSYAGTGIFKSSNGGKTWQYAGLPESHHIGAIILHPGNPQVAWVAVLGHLFSANKERGVYKTADGGATWQQTLYTNDNTGAVDLAINPQNPNELYATTWYRTRRAWAFEESGPTGGIHKSTDGGQTWKLISGPGSGFMQGPKIGRIGICVYPKNPQILYAVVDNNNPLPPGPKKPGDTFYTKGDLKNLTLDEALALDNSKLDTFLKRNGFPRKYTAKAVKELWGKGAIKPSALYDFLDSDDGFQNTGIHGCQVYRSNNGGQSWAITHDSALNVFMTYGYYFGKIYVSPVNADKVFIPGFTIQLSTDGGKKWATIDKSNVHLDHHAFWINPQRDSHIIDGNDGGLNISYDDGKHWFKANTPPVGQFYAVTTDNNPRGYNVYGGLQDNGVWFGPASNNEANGDWYDNGHNPFRSINGGDGMQVQVDPRDNKTVYSGSQFGFYSRRHTDSTRGGASVTPRHDLGEFPLRFNWQTPIWLSRHNPDVFYIGSNRLHRSLNRGDSYDLGTPDLTNGKKAGNVPYGTIVTLAESPLRFGLLYTGSDDGVVQVSKDGGYTFNRITKGLPADLYVSRVIAGSKKEGRVIVSLNGYRNDHFAPYLFISDDYGATWRSISANLPMEPINVVREDPTNDSILYVGTDGGLYVSLNLGASFMAWNRGLPASVPIHDIAIQPRDNEIVLGTHGRSLYVAKLKEVQEKGK